MLFYLLLFYLYVIISNWVIISQTNTALESGNRSRSEMMRPRLRLTLKRKNILVEIFTKESNIFQKRIRLLKICVLVDTVIICLCFKQNFVVFYTFLTILVLKRWKVRLKVKDQLEPEVQHNE